jgi:hypothetical protein
MRKWIWASTLLTVAVACGFYGVARWANQHPLSVLNYGARLASVVGMGHTRVIPACPDANPDEDGPRAIVQELPDASPTHEIDEPIVVENAQPIPPDISEPPVNEPNALPPLVEESEPPVLVMPPCPEDEPVAASKLDPQAFLRMRYDEIQEMGRTEELRLGAPLLGTVSVQERQTSGQSVLPQSPDQSILPVKGEVPNCEVDPNYHHLYPGCPWMGGCQNIPAYVPLMPVERTRTRPAKNKWLAVQALMERLGLSGFEPCEMPDPADDGEPTDLTDIIF